MSCENPFLCRNSGTWYTPPDRIRQPERFYIPGAGTTSTDYATSASVLQNMRHYAVESESAFYSPKKQYTIVPQYIYTVAGVVSDNQPRETVPAHSWIPQAKHVTRNLVNQNYEPIRHLFNPF